MTDIVRRYVDKNSRAMTPTSSRQLQRLLSRVPRDVIDDLLVPQRDLAFPADPSLPGGCGPREPIVPYVEVGDGMCINPKWMSFMGPASAGPPCSIFSGVPIFQPTSQNVEIMRVSPWPAFSVPVDLADYVKQDFAPTYMYAVNAAYDNGKYVATLRIRRESGETNNLGAAMFSALAIDLYNTAVLFGNMGPIETPLKVEYTPAMTAQFTNLLPVSANTPTLVQQCNISCNATGGRERVWVHFGNAGYVGGTETQGNFTPIKALVMSPGITSSTDDDQQEIVLRVTLGSTDSPLPNPGTATGAVRIVVKPVVPNTDIYKAYFAWLAARQAMGWVF
jgi:hypothetical protein